MASRKKYRDVQVGESFSFSELGTLQHWAAVILHNMPKRNHKGRFVKLLMSSTITCDACPQDAATIEGLHNMLTLLRSSHNVAG